MKFRSLLLSFFFITQITTANETILKLMTQGFGVYIENHKDVIHYSGGLRYKIGMQKDIENNSNWNYLNLGIIEGKNTTSIDFDVTAFEKKNEANNVESVIATLKHKYLPLEAKVKFSVYGKTGVLTSSVSLKNISNIYPLRINRIPSLEAVFPASDYEYSYLTCGWANERKIQTKAIEKDTVQYGSKSGRSSTDFSPWISIHDKSKDIYYNAQFAWSGNWSLFMFNDTNTKNLKFQFCEYFDNNQLTLLPTKEIELPKVAISGGYNSMDVAANNLHRYQRQYLLKIQSNNDPMLVQFNSWFPLQINITSENLKPYIDEAVDLGLEVLTIDSGWYVKESFEKEVGIWETNKAKFPTGLRETADYVRSKGMKFGLWFEIESAGQGSEIAKRHPEWCLQYNGKPVSCPDWSNRNHLDFSNPEAFDWALAQFDKMYQECGGIDWVKLDYNISIGSQFDNVNGIALGTALRNHVTAFYRWLDVLGQKYPKLILENCSSGALRMDIGILEHTHTSFVSDETSVNPSLGMAWSSTLEYTPRMINHWTVGMDNHYPVIDESLSRGYWDYMFRVPMNGQFGISSRITEWSPELKKCAKENIELYKRIRTIIADADVYHLTPQPDYKDPQNWTVMLYVANEGKQAVAMVNRGRGGDDVYTLKMNQLKHSSRYQVEIDGKSHGNYSGSNLAKDGLKVKLDNYRASVIVLKEN